MFPLMARSEFVRRPSPGVLAFVNLSDGGVVETSRRFQIASPAFHHPARSPTRGSGLGGDIDMLAPGDDAVSEEGADAHAEVSRSPAVSARVATRALDHRAPER
jgi:hypothetical protein